MTVNPPIQDPYPSQDLAPGVFSHERIVRFRDTDAAGVVYFGAVLDFCHEAYERSLAAAGLDLRVFFSSQGYGVPIARAEVTFLRPLFCGDRLTITLKPEQTGPHRFEVAYELCLTDQPDQPVGQARTHHVCLDGTTRSRLTLPPELLTWLAAGG